MMSITPPPIIVNEPETAGAAELATMLISRRMWPDDEHGFMRCQLGSWEFPANGWPVFRLVAHGGTWQSAYRMWQRKT